MKKLITLILLTPMLVTAQSDSTAGSITLSENVMDCINNVYDNPDAIKHLLQSLVSNKEKFREIYRQIVNDPEMKDVLRELKDDMREDRGVLEKNRKYRTNINKNSPDVTYRE